MNQGGRRRSPRPRNERYAGPAMNQRGRRRSLSPSGDRFRRNSPSFKRRREEPFYGNGRFPERFADEYGRRSPYQERFDYSGQAAYRDAYGARAPTPPPRQRGGPPSFKEFMAQLPDEVTPDQAQIQYKAHMAQYFGSAVKAEFEASKNDEWMRRKYHPRDQEQGLKDRNVACLEEAARFTLEADSDSLDVAAQGKVQGADGEAEAEDDQEAPTAPEAAWKAERILTDLKLTQQLRKKLDAEKGIGVKAPAAEAAKPAPAEPAEPVEADAAAAPTAEADPAAAAETPAAAAAAAAGEEPAAAEEETATADTEMADAAAPATAAVAEPAADAAAAAAPELAAEDAAEAMADDKPADTTAPMEAAEDDTFPEDYDEQVKQLDINVLYLWRVHGVDYYAGLELAEPAEWGVHLVQLRTLRGPRPEEGEEADAAQEKQELKQMDKKISIFWKKRMTVSDPYEVRLQKDKVEKQIDDFVEAQVKQLDANKWGNTLSKKLFKGKEYVLKHIRVKHAHVLEEQVNAIHEAMYWDNYREDMEGQEAQRQEVAAENLKAQQQVAMQAAVPPTSQAAAMNGEAAPEAEGEETHATEGDGNAAGGRRRAGNAGRGNRSRSGMMGMGRGGMMAGADGMMMGGMMMGGPMPGQMLVPAPGAGPFGPFIQVPIGGGAGPMGGDMMRPMMGGGRGRGRGRGRGGFGGGGNMMGMQGSGAYYDLDAPENQRSVLDYGDL